MLNPINTEGYSKPKEWCGPAAIATLTGIPLREATELAVRVHGGTYDDLEGMWPEDVIIALHQLGYRAKPVDIIGRFPHLTHGPQLKSYVSSQPPEEKINPVLITVSGHFICSHMWFLNDNWTLTPKHYADFPKPKRLVKSAHIITKG